MESLPALKVPEPTEKVTFSWMDSVEEVSLGGNETIKILFKECDQYPDVPYVQLPTLYVSFSFLKIVVILY